jgi:hypothetical protein
MIKQYLFAGDNSLPERYFEDEQISLNESTGVIKGLLKRISFRHGGALKIGNQWYSIQRLTSKIKIDDGTAGNDGGKYVEVLTENA